MHTRIRIRLDARYAQRRRARTPACPYDVLIDRHVFGVVIHIDRFDRLRLTKATDLFAQVGQRNDTRIPFRGAQRDTVVEDIANDHFLFAERRLQNLPFLGEATTTLHVEFMLVAQAAHETTAGTGNLLRIER